MLLLTATFVPLASAALLIAARSASCFYKRRIYPRRISRMPANPKRPHILTLLPVVFIVGGLICLAGAGWGSIAPALYPPQTLSAPTGAAIASAAVSRAGVAAL